MPVILTLEDLPSATADLVSPLPANYHGLNWRGFQVVNSRHELLRDAKQCGYRTALVSGGHVAIIGAATDIPAEVRAPKGESFDLHHAFVGAADTNELKLQWQGFREGKLIHSKNLTVDSLYPSLTLFDFNGIDTLRISTTAGVSLGHCPPAGAAIGAEAVIDDLSVTLHRRAPQGKRAPEPPPAPKEKPAQELQLIEKPFLAPSPAGAPEQDLAEPPVIEEPPVSPSEETTDVEAVSPPKPVARPQGRCYGVQVGAYRSNTGAESVREKMSGKYGATSLYPLGPGRTDVQRVVVGCMESRQEAAGLMRRMKQDGVSGFVVAVNPVDGAESFSR